MTTSQSGARPPEFFSEIAKIGIVIQGPLVSRGRNGATANIKRRNVRPEHIVEFDCVENIGRLFGEFGGFGKIVCMVWEDEVPEKVEALQNLVGAEHVVTIANETKTVKAKKGMLPGNNKYRQFHSSLKGVEILADAGCEYAIKIRSDQYLDLYKLASDLLKIKAARDRFIMVSRLHAGSSVDHLADFYIGGRTRDLQACFSAYLGEPELYRNVHTDIFYRFASVMLGAPGFPPRILGIKTNMGYVRKAWNRLYCPASHAVFAPMVWRGEPCEINREKLKFLEDLPADLSVPNDVLR